ncbi:MAG: hypothetical protein ACLFUC_05815 [Bacteroidales bacterium]
MEKAGSTFIKHFSLYGLVILIATGIVHYLIPGISLGWGLAFLLYAWLITATFHMAIMNSAKKRTSIFQKNFMLATGIKFLAYLLFLLIFLFIGRTDENLIPFLIMFLSIYLLFSIFEVIYITTFFKDK